MDLQGAVVVVTGAARGLGAEIAGAFAGAGASIAAVDLLEDDLDTTIGGIAAFSGGRAVPIQADVSSPADVQEMVWKTEDAFGPIDVLINAAGSISAVGPVWEADPDEWLQDVKVNLYSTFLCCRAVAKGMVERGGGYILNVVGPDEPEDLGAFCTAYAGAKTALTRLTEALAREGSPHGLKAFAIAPTPVRTDMAEFILGNGGRRKHLAGYAKVFDDGRDAPIDAISKLAMELISGRADRLTGRQFAAPCDFDEIVARTDEILAGDLMTLRLRR